MGLVDEYTGQSQTLEILNKVDGKAIAIDVTIWMVEAMTQPNLREVFHSDLARVLKVCFDRVRLSRVQILVHWNESRAPSYSG